MGLKQRVNSVSTVTACISVVAVLLAITVVVLALLLCQTRRRHANIPRIKTQGSTQAGTQGSCSSASCSAIDPVNEPDYNMKETIKNTLLIEQHLAEKRKYCKPCLVKHFLLSIGLIEEAIWMAHGKEYPMMAESDTLYNDLFKQWHADMDDGQNILDVLGKLRDWRRKATEAYYF
jgi:hypothetical protein